MSATIVLNPERNGKKSVPSLLKHPRFTIISSDGTTKEISSNDDGSGAGMPTANLDNSPGDSRKITSDTLTIPILAHRRQSDHSTGCTISSAHMASIGYATQEAVPMTIFYRNENSVSTSTPKTRPTLVELREESKGARYPQQRESAPNSPSVKGRLGWIKGVMFPCMLNIWGVILFIRMPWIVGQAGMTLSSVIVCLATAVTVVTTLSMSAICTNGKVRGGGAYYLISRSLGPEFGGSIGIIFSLANAIAVALYLVGFAETIRDVMAANGLQIISPLNDIRLIALLALVLLFIIALVGLGFVMRLQVVLLLVLVASIISVLGGTFYPAPSMERNEIQSYGITGYLYANFENNVMPNYRQGNGFFSVFAIFFPAATGILAGANLSGDLKNASTAVPRGTLTAIVVTGISYLALCWLIGSSVARDATGIIGAAVMPNNLTCAQTQCPYGMMNDFQVMQKISLWSPLVTAGIVAATLSSALASLVSAPKVFQAVCSDHIFPHIAVMGKGYGANNEPRLSYILTFFIGGAFVAIGDLNVIAPIISNFFLMAYALINYSVFAASLAKSPGWRPAFKYYNMWASLVGFLLCVAIMFLINWWAALVTIACVAAIYKYVDLRKPDINWGSSGQAHTYLKALRFVRRLDNVTEHIKNFRVQCLALTGRPSLRPNLTHFVSHLTKHFGLMICGEVHVGSELRTQHVKENPWLRRHKINAFHHSVSGSSVREGAQFLMQCAGLGKLRPNTLFIGYMSKWENSSDSDVNDYVGIIHDAFDLDYGVAILRLEHGFDITDDIDDDDETIFTNPQPDWYTEEWDETNCGQSSESSHSREQASGQDVANPEIVISFNKKDKGTIDVWWLYDDGGLTILVPHLLSLGRFWRGNKLRIFTPACDKNIKANQIRMANLLKKFRIDFSSVVEFRGINKQPSHESITHYKTLAEGRHFTLQGAGLDKKTLRQIRLGELVREHSSKAKLVVMTLPVPKRETTTSLTYMAWLDVLSGDLPPVLLIRGNQTSVLTFYS